MKFPKALKKLLKGAEMTRESWSTKGAYVQAVTASDGVRGHFLIDFNDGSGEYSMWVPSTGDLFAEDWKEVE